MQPRISAGAYFSAGLGLVSLAVGFFWAAYRPEYIGLGIVFSLVAVGCFVGAWRSYGEAHNSLSGAVSYPQFMKTRNQLRAELAERDATIAELREKLDALASQHAATARRSLDMIATISAANRLSDEAKAELKKHAIIIQPVPTIHDSGVIANQIKEALETTGLHPRVHENALSRNECPFRESGIWILGEKNRVSEIALGGMLRGLIPPVEVVDYVSPDWGPRYTGFEIWIVIGGQTFGEFHAAWLHEAIINYPKFIEEMKKSPDSES